MEALEKYKKQNMESFYYCDAIKHTQFDSLAEYILGISTGVIREQPTLITNNINELLYPELYSDKTIYTGFTFDTTNDTSDCTTCKYMNGSMVVEPCFSCKGTGGEELNYVELL